MNKKKRIVLIGPVPPPTGGVSIHVWRLYELLKEDFDLGFIDESRAVKQEYFNLRSFNLFRYFGIILKSDAVFIHSGTNALRIFHILVARFLFKKVVITLHAYPEKKTGWKKKAHEFVFGLAHQIILVNSDILERVHLPEKKVVIRHAFLPPVIEHEKKLPDVITDILTGARKEGKSLICSNAWRLDQFQNQDLYGVDMCIEATRRLVNKGVPLTFIFNIATIDSFQDRFENYKSQIQNLGLSQNFILANESLSFVRLMQECDIVVRPTNTDGDSLTIREALFLGKPIITSDVVVRPTGSILHINRNIDDFEEKIAETLEVSGRKEKLNGNYQDSSYAAFYKNIFRKLLE